MKERHTSGDNMRMVVDRIQESIAVCLMGEKEVKVDIPLEYLPEGTKEGSWIDVDFKLDLSGEQKQREKISKLLDKLKNKDL